MQNRKMTALASLLKRGQIFLNRRSKCFSLIGIRTETVKPFSGKMLPSSRRRRRRISVELRTLEFPILRPSAGSDSAENSCISATWRDGGEVFNRSYCSEGAQSIFNLLTELAKETEALIFSMPAPEGGWRCPLCGMQNGRSALCMECGVMRSAK